MITRRKLVLALGAGALASPLSSFTPLAVLAQPAKKVWRIGYLAGNQQSVNIPWFDAFKAGMSALGYAEGSDYMIEVRPTAELDRLPAAYSISQYVETGGLFAYAADFTDLFWRAAVFVDKIFKGTKPGNIPIEQPTRFDFILNMKTAKALGLKIPGSILVQVTKVIDKRNF